MAELSAKKYVIEQLQANGDLQVLHPETEAVVVKVDDITTDVTTYEYGNVQNAIEDHIEQLEGIYDQLDNLNATSINTNEFEYGDITVELGTVQEGLETLYDMVQNSGATSSASIITSEIYNGRPYDTTKYTVYETVEQVDGAILTSSNSLQFELGPAAIMDVSNSIGSSSTDEQLATAQAVYQAIEALPEPMLFKGSLGTGGTITTLPAASSANEGFVYKVITAGTYQGLVCKVGDTVISNGVEWTLIPSGDEPSGTVTSVGLSMPTGFSVDGSPITSSGTFNVTMTSGYMIPTTDQANTWTAKQDAITSSNKLSADLLQDGTTNHVFTAADDTKLTDIETGAQVNVLEGISLNGSTVSITSKIANLGNLVVANAAITPGTYSVVSYDAKGLVTAGGNVLEIGTTGQTTPSQTLVVGGIFFKEI